MITDIWHGPPKIRSLWEIRDDWSRLYSSILACDTFVICLAVPFLGDFRFLYIIKSGFPEIWACPQIISFFFDFPLQTIHFFWGTPMTTDPPRRDHPLLRRCTSLNTSIVSTRRGRLEWAKTRAKAEFHRFSWRNGHIFVALGVKCQLRNFFPPSHQGSHQP